MLKKDCEIEAIAWDNESVLTSPDWRLCYDKAYELLGMEPALKDDPARGKMYKKMLSIPIDAKINRTLVTFKSGLEQSNYLQSYSCGNICSEEFWPIVCKYGFGLNPLVENVRAIRTSQRYLLRNHEGHVQDIPEVVEILKSAAKVLPQFMLSNTNPEIYNGFKDAEFLTCIDEANQLFSIFIKCRKPAAPAYQKLIKHAEVNPEHILFIDDKESNIEAARQYGIKGILFNGQRESVDILIYRLNAFGIMVFR